MTLFRRYFFNNFSFSLLIHLSLVSLLYTWAKAEKNPVEPKEIQLDFSLPTQQPKMPAMPEQQFPNYQNYQDLSGGGTPWLIPRMGDYVSAEAAASKPRWVEGLFGYYSDIPKSAIPGDIKGDLHTFMVIDIYVDAAGKVQAARAVVGSNSALDEYVLEKVKQAHFEPAKNVQGNPIACKLRFPLSIGIFHDNASRYRGSVLTR